MRTVGVWVVRMRGRRGVACAHSGRVVVVVSQNGVYRLFCERANVEVAWVWRKWRRVEEVAHGAIEECGPRREWGADDCFVVRCEHDWANGDVVFDGNVECGGCLACIKIEDATTNGVGRRPK